MLTAGDGTVFIDGTFAVTCKMNAGIVYEQVPPCGILEHFHVVVIELPQQTIKVNNRTGCGNLYSKVMAAGIPAANTSL